MIRLFVRFASWLDARFPAKVVVTKEAYEGLVSQAYRTGVELDLLRGEFNELKASHAATVDRISHLEATSVHKGAVSDLIQHFNALKAKQTALEANLGWVPNAGRAADIMASLNGEPISNE